MRVLKLAQTDFRGGINTYSVDDGLSPNDLTDMRNMRINKRFGGIQQIGGSILNLALYGSPFSSTIKLNYLSKLYRSDGNSYYIGQFTASGAKLIFSKGSDDSYAQESFSGIDNITDTAIHGDYLYFVIGTAFVYKTNGAVAGTLLDSEPMPAGFKPTVLESYNNRMYYAGDPTQPHTLIASVPASPDVFDSPFVEPIYKIGGEDGDIITSLNTYGGNLIVFKRRSIYVVQGSLPKAITKFPGDHIGCIDIKTMQKTEMGLIFLSQAGVYLFNGNSLRPLSTKIKNDLIAILRETDGSFSSAYYDKTYYLFYKPFGGDRISEGYSFDLTELEYGESNIPISRISGLELAGSVVFNDVGRKQTWLGYLDDSNVIVECDIDGKNTFYERNGTTPTEVNISPLVATQWFDFGDRSRVKELVYIIIGTYTPIQEGSIKIFIDLRSQYSEEEITFTGVVDGTLWDNGKWDVNKWDDNVGFYTYKITFPTGYYANRVKFQIEVSESDIFSMDRLELHYRNLRDV